MTAQFVSFIMLSSTSTDNKKEHTILLRPTVKEVVSRGEDY